METQKNPEEKISGECRFFLLKETESQGSVKREILFFFYFLENPKKFRGEYTKNQEKIVKEGKGENEG